MSLKFGKTLFRVLTGVVIGSAIGSILGLTLAPRKGSETRKMIRDKSMGVFLKSKEALEENECGRIKKLIIRFLSKKKKSNV